MFDKNLILALVAVLVLGGYMFFDQNKKVVPPQVAAPKYTEGQSVEVTGKMICLSHASKGLVQTMECAMGVADKDGVEYGLQDKDNKFYSQLSQNNTSRTIKGIYHQSTSTIYSAKGNIEVKEVK